MVVGLSFGSPTSGDGFDVSKTVSAIMANMQAVETPWKDQITALQSQDTVLSTLGTLMSKLSTDVTSLTDTSGVLSEKMGSSSNTGVLELTSASTTALAGTHAVLVNNLAATSSGYLTEITNSSDTLAGSIVLQVGSGTAQTFTLSSSNNTLAGMAKTINSSGVGVTASVLTDATGSRLSLVSGTSGAGGNLTITSNITDTSNLNAALSYTNAVTGANASLTVDGVSLTTSSNTVSNLIPGVTFQLLSASTTPVQVVIGNYNAGVESTIASMVSDYNSLLSAMNEQEGKDSSGKSEPLYGSPTLTMLQQNILGGINKTNPNGYLDSISTSASADTTLSGSITIKVGTGTAQTITVDSTNNTLTGLAAAINSANIGVTAAVVTSSGNATLTLASHTTGSGGALVINSAIVASSNTALGFTNTTDASTTGYYASGTVETVAASTDTLSGSVVIKVGSGTAQTITMSPSASTLADLALAINNASLGVSATIETDTTTGASALKLVSDTAGADGALSVSSTLYDTTSKTDTTLGYTNSSDITSLSALGISISANGTLSFDAATLDSVLNSDFSGVQGLFQNANSWGVTFAKTLTEAGDTSSKGVLKLAENEISSIEATLNADISREEILISAQEKSLTAQLNAANQILQMLPSQLSQVNMLYSAITGYNQNG